MIENLFDSKENLQIKVKNLEEVKELQEAYNPIERNQRRATEPCSVREFGIEHTGHRDVK